MFSKATNIKQMWENTGKKVNSVCLNSVSFKETWPCVSPASWETEVDSDAIIIKNNLFGVALKDAILYLPSYLFLL